MDRPAELILPDESYRIVGACLEVYGEKGCGFLEPVYHDCLEIELGLQAIPFIHEPTLELSYKGIPLPRRYTPDFTCWGKVIVELKAEKCLNDAHVSQVLNYLNASGYDLGILANFGHHPGLEWRRIVRTQRS